MFNPFNRRNHVAPSNWKCHICLFNHHLTCNQSTQTLATYTVDRLRPRFCSLWTYCHPHLALLSALLTPFLIREVNTTLTVIKTVATEDNCEPIGSRFRVARSCASAQPKSQFPLQLSPRVPDVFVLLIPKICLMRQSSGTMYKPRMSHTQESFSRMLKA